MALDAGGSSTLAFDGEVLNALRRPPTRRSRGAVRLLLRGLRAAAAACSRPTATGGRRRSVAAKVVRAVDRDGRTLVGPDRTEGDRERAARHLGLDLRDGVRPDAELERGPPQRWVLGPTTSGGTRRDDRGPGRSGSTTDARTTCRHGRRGRRSPAPVGRQRRARLSARRAGRRLVATWRRRWQTHPRPLAGLVRAPSRTIAITRDLGRADQVRVGVRPTARAVRSAAGVIRSAPPAARRREPAAAAVPPRPRGSPKMTILAN